MNGGPERVRPIACFSPRRETGCGVDVRGSPCQAPVVGIETGTVKWHRPDRETSRRASPLIASGRLYPARRAAQLTRRPDPIIPPFRSTGGRPAHGFFSFLLPCEPASRNIVSDG
jgi:hypothetical protein